MSPSPSMSPPMNAEAEYNNRARVPDSATIIARWARDSAAFRDTPPEGSLLDIPYGPTPRQTVDVFGPLAADRPAALLIHGGYWQALSGADIAIFARGLIRLGITVIIPTTDLCPAIPVSMMVNQLHAALARLTTPRLLAIGHSAGGHLAAMLAAEHHPRIGALLPISGVFELEPLLGTTIAAKLNLTPPVAQLLSPRFRPSPNLPLHAVVGAEESAEFRRQTIDFATAWSGTHEALPGLNHFTILDPLTDPDHPLTQRAAAMARALA